MASGSRRRKIHLPGVLLALLLIIPGAQLLSGVPDAPIWQAFIYLVDAFALIMLLGLPWLGASWARQLRRRLIIKNPDAVASIVAMWRDGDESQRLGVLLVNSSGLTFYDSPTSESTIGSDATVISTVQEGTFARESIYLTVGDLVAMRFVPMGRAGIEPLSPLRLANFVLAIRRTGHGVVETS
ncbi:MAG: hypothetical protein JWO18_308 [Microbacteriaceae bacterium]|jgi:hypothetical protein|nr:hypothetical protein [Microbacteriaceae bacterium]